MTCGICGQFDKINWAQKNSNLDTRELCFFSLSVWLPLDCAVSELTTCNKPFFGPRLDRASLRFVWSQHRLPLPQCQILTPPAACSPENDQNQLDRYSQWNMWKCKELGIERQNFFIARVVSFTTNNNNQRWLRSRDTHHYHRLWRWLVPLDLVQAQ